MPLTMPETSKPARAFSDEEIDYLLSHPMQVPQGWGEFICRCLTTMAVQRSIIKGWKEGS